MPSQHLSDNLHGHHRGNRRALRPRNGRATLIAAQVAVRWPEIRHAVTLGVQVLARVHGHHSVSRSESCTHSPFEVIRVGILRCLVGRARRFYAGIMQVTHVSHTFQCSLFCSRRCLSRIVGRSQVRQFGQVSISTSHGLRNAIIRNFRSNLGIFLKFMLHTLLGARPLVLLAISLY